MIIGTSADRISERMERIMNDISSAGTAKSDGSIRRLRPFEIAVLLIPAMNGGMVRVINASDDEFQMFVLTAGLPIDDNGGIAEWSFDDRVGIINHALKHGVALPFVDPNKNNSDSEQKTIPEKQPKVAQEAR
jgi:hypothetical protein